MALPRWLPIALLGCLSATTAVAQIAFTTIPATPVAGEAFIVREHITSGMEESLLNGSVAITGNRVDLTMRTLVTDFNETESEPHDITFAVTVPAAGAFTFYQSAMTTYDEVSFNTNGPQAIGVVNVAAALPGAIPASAALSGLYYDPAAPGSGVTIEQGVSGQVFATIYTQGLVSGSNQLEPVWHVMSSGKWISPTRFRGVLSKTRGTSAKAAFQPASLVMAPVAVLTLDFSIANGVTLSVEGATLPITASTLTKFRF